MGVFLVAPRFQLWQGGIKTSSYPDLPNLGERQMGIWQIYIRYRLTKPERTKAYQTS